MWCWCSWKSWCVFFFSQRFIVLAERYFLASWMLCLAKWLWGVACIVELLYDMNIIHLYDIRGKIGNSVTEFCLHTYALCITYIYIQNVYIPGRFTQMVPEICQTKIPIYPNSPARQRPEAIHDAKENCSVDWSCLFKNPCFLFSPFYSIGTSKTVNAQARMFLLRKLVQSWERVQCKYVQIINNFCCICTMKLSKLESTKHEVTLISWKREQWKLIFWHVSQPTSRTVTNWSKDCEKMHCFEHPEQSESWYQAECHSKDLFLQKTHGDEGRWVALSSLNFVALNRSNYFNKCLESKSISLSWFSSGGGWFANENFQHDMATVHFWWII